MIYYYLNRERETIKVTVHKALRELSCGVARSNEDQQDQNEKPQNEHYF